MTPRLMTSEMLRVASVIPFTFAVAASNASIVDKERFALMRPHSSATACRMRSSKAAAFATSRRGAAFLSMNSTSYLLAGSFSNGSTTARSIGAKWRLLRERIVRSCRCAVAAIAISAKPGE